MSDVFTLEHFEEWAGRLVLDSGAKWKLEDFQRAFVADVFAGVPECWLVVPEGTGKSTLVAGLAMYHAQFTPDAWVPIAASSRDQARIMYRQARGFVSRSTALAGFRCFDGYRRVDYRPQGSQIEVFAADDRTGDGIIPSLCILDELHRHRSLNLYETWRGKLGKRDAQIVTISTAGEPGSEFELVRERIRQLADELDRRETFVRARSESVVLHEWAVPEDGDVEDMELVARANPFSGVTAATLRKNFDSPTMTMAHWRRFKCNLPTRSDMAAITENEWADARVEDGIPEGEPVWIGLDLGWKYDPTAIVPLWWRDPEYRLLGPATILTPPRNGAQLDAHLVEDALLAMHDRNPVERVVMDMTAGEQLSQWIAETIGAEVVDRSQGNAAAVLDHTRFMEALRMGWLRHTGDPGLTRHVLNAITRVLPGGDARFARPAESRTVNESLAARRHIDALVAGAMVHCEAADPAKAYVMSW